jgi:hypothetical protein
LFFDGGVKERDPWFELPLAFPRFPALAGVTRASLGDMAGA